MNKTETKIKQATIHYVLNWLNKKSEYEKQISKLNDEKDVDKAYIIANRYARNYIHLSKADEKEKFLKCVDELANKWVENGNKWIDEDFSNVEEVDKQQITNEVENESNQVTVETLGNSIVNESDNRFVEKIIESDVDIENKCKIRNVEEKNSLLLMKAFFENNLVKIKKEFLDKFNINKELIGYRDGSEVYYCEGINGVFEIF